MATTAEKLAGNLNFGALGQATELRNRLLFTLGVLIIFNTLGLRLILVNSYYHHRDHYFSRWRYVYGILRVWLIFFNRTQIIC